MFDPETHEMTRKVLNRQQWLKHNDGSVGWDEMEVLKLLASGADLDRDITPFLKLIESNAEK
jgi:hypothetical protein